MITLETLKARPLSYSSLIAFKRSPLHYIHYLQERREQTPAMLMGSLIDRILFNPDEFDKETGLPIKESKFVIKPDFSRGEGIRAKAEAWKQENKGKDWITEEQLTEAHKIVKAVNENSISKEKILQVTAVQKRIAWEDKETGLPIIGYLDMEAGDEFICDLKTTVDAHPEEFAKSCMNFDYHIQTAIYLDAAAHRGKFPDYYNIVVEKTAPYGVSVLKADNEFIALGKQEYRKLLQEFKYCMEVDGWGMSYEFRSISGYYQNSLPGWAKNKLHQ